MALVTKFVQQRDGGWIITVYGGDADAAGFQALMQWLHDHEAKMKELSEETRRYEHARIMVESMPDVKQMLADLTQKWGGTDIEVICYAINAYQMCLEAIRRGEQLAIIGKNGQITPVSVDIPWIKPSDHPDEIKFPQAAPEPPSSEPLPPPPA